MTGQKLNMSYNKLKSQSSIQRMKPIDANEIRYVSNGSGEQSEHDKMLLAHCCNRFDEVLGALDRAIMHMDEMSQVKVLHKDEEFHLATMKDVIKRAKEVNP